MAAAGGAIGTAIAPGIGTAIGTIAGGLLDGPMTGGGGAPAGPTSASAATAVYGSGLNADNWFVNFSGTQKASATLDKAFSATGPTASTAAQGGTILPAAGAGLAGMVSSMGLGGVPVWAWACLGGLVIWKLKSNK